jgi:hypothetical protein
VTTDTDRFTMARKVLTIMARVGNCDHTIKLSRTYWLAEFGKYLPSPYERLHAEKIERILDLQQPNRKARCRYRGIEIGTAGWKGPPIQQAVIMSNQQKDGTPMAGSDQVSLVKDGLALQNHDSNHLPFFADATLDLEEAHDIADTPEPTRPVTRPNKLQIAAAVEQIPMPTLHFLESPTADSFADANVDPRTVADATSTGSSIPTNSISRESPDDKSTFARITSLETAYPSMSRTQHSVPRWPRDLPWAIAFVLFVPTGLLWPILTQTEANESSHAITSHPLSTASLHGLFWSALASVLLSRALYRTPSGGEGDDARFHIAQLLTLAAPVAVCVYVALVLLILLACPHAALAALVPAWFAVKDMYLFRRWKQRRSAQFNGPTESPSTSAFSAVQSVGGTRQAFFQALMGMTLDILSRSLRRASFYRVLSGVLIVQCITVWLWRWALLAALTISGSSSPFGAHSKGIIFMVAFVAGKWATGTVARLLSLLACGGVTSWVAVQQELQSVNNNPMFYSQGSNSNSRNGTYDADRDENIGYSEDETNDMPEAYRTVDASVYQSVLSIEDDLDDDYELDDDEFMEAPSRREHSRRRENAQPQSTVKSILLVGLSISFGSVAQCGLVGGLAQFMWSQLRVVEAARTVLSEVRRDSGFHNMTIGSNEAGFFGKMCKCMHNMARKFVRNHSDLAMTHVAAFYKSYQKAARDVSTLIDESGTLLDS